MLRAATDAGYALPRPIQAATIPPALEGRDVLGLAQTGTGKTAAFVLPILERLVGGRRGPIRALVVTPTRELSAQVHDEFVKLGAHTKITSTLAFGGVPIARQIRALRAKPDVVVGCPGRLLDLHGQGELRLDGVEVLVLDEADHMFDMGFLPDVRRILRALPKKRQNLLFSATMPKEIRGLADSILVQPTVVELEHSRPASTIEHALVRIPEGAKMGALERLLGSDEFTSAIVFLRTKRRAKQLAQKLSAQGHAAVALQGNMSQPQREKAMAGFRSGAFEILVATDIAARGLDIAGVSHVVNFDVPMTPEAYTHRIGRTGRSEMTGMAFTFATPNDGTQIRAIEKRLGKPIPVRELGSIGPKAAGASARPVPPRTARRAACRRRARRPAARARRVGIATAPPRTAVRRRPGSGSRLR
ncbi:MAG: DEAD/DEAH box helicase [Planctomycetota bacterium]